MYRKRVESHYFCSVLSSCEPQDKQGNCFIFRFSPCAFRIQPNVTIRGPALYCSVHGPPHPFRPQHFRKATIVLLSPHIFTMASPSSTASTPACKRLVLDAGPLLSLSPLRGLAETYVTVPQVLAELKDKRAREHFEKLALVTGVKVEIQAPDAASLSHGASPLLRFLLQCRMRF